MAFPWTTETNFEDGTTGNFASETDTESRLDIAHYAELARFPHTHTAMPFRGAYCMRVALENDGSPADAYVTDTDWDVTVDSETMFWRIVFWVSPDIVMASTDEFAIWQVASSGPTVEAGAYINYTTADGYRLGIGEGSATSFIPLSLGKWHTLEIKFVPGSSSDSTLDAWLDGGSLTQVGSFTSATTVQGYLGVIGQDSGTTAGTILFDHVISDESRLFYQVDRFPDSALLTTSGHVFVGRGSIAHAYLLSSSTDGVLTIYDTDSGYTSDTWNVVSELKNTSTNQAVPEFPLIVKRGCYVSLSGTNPRALVRIDRADHYSDGAMRSFARIRKAAAFGG